MPKRTDISSILIIGAGPIVIGQACEFDYSGTQACKALRAEGYRVILVNSNPATIMTDPDTASATYIEPVNAEMVRRVIERERPDALLATMGGQTALNVARELAKNGTLAEFGVELIGARLEAIEVAEDRERFRHAMSAIGLETARARAVGSVDAALAALEHTGLPAIVRPSFTLGGQGGGVAYNREEFEQIVQAGLRLSPVREVLVEESVLGWKEFEMEVVRDSQDNCIIVCSIENIDPMGVHTGDSITVAPALTLTDKELQTMRDASIAVLRAVGVDTGGSNVQFAVDPNSGRQLVIEMNPRVSRSSALASKATGFPIAKVAAKLAVGYTLPELRNEITAITPASFEPALDYVVVKIPRFAFEKFPGADARLTTSMKSVGEVMAIGGTFAESLQKALRGLEVGQDGLGDVVLPGARGTVRERARASGELSVATSDRLFKIADAFRAGWTVEDVHEACLIDRWFLRQIEALVKRELRLETEGAPKSAGEWQRLKSQGFSDARIAKLTGNTEAFVAKQRRAAGVRPSFKRIDTCAGELPSSTAYLYSTYEPGLTHANPGRSEVYPSGAEKILILGGGPNRIGQGIEFDYCCVHAAYALTGAGYETIMVNCNPETVSTDYDTASRLYFEPLTAEDVLELAHAEGEAGVILGAIVQYGGQTPLRLAHALEAQGLPILGTSPDAIDLAEDRERFQKLLRRVGLRQPENGVATNTEQALAVANTVGYPVVLRPSYVLGGRAMEIVHDDAGIRRYLERAVAVSGSNPVLVDKFLRNAIEVDVDALSDGETVLVAGIMEHIEEAGIHSGDSACSLPPTSLSAAMCAELERQTELLAKELGVVGLLNIQFAVKDQDVFVLEVNPRASRTVPFVAKATGIPLARYGALVMAGTQARSLEWAPVRSGLIAVKEAVFPFARFPGTDILLGPEMKSTGEVMGLAASFGLAFAKAQLAASMELPTAGRVFFSVKDDDKPEIASVAQGFEALGFEVLATRGTAAVIRAAGGNATVVRQVHEARPHIVDQLLSGEVALVVNTTSGAEDAKETFALRSAALSHAIPYCTTVAGARSALRAIEALRTAPLEIMSLQQAHGLSG
jgi:carbamoyl-phosphate synthase large subunit